MTTGWSDESPGRIRIPLRVPLAGRLFGIPFLLVGLWFLWQFGAALFWGARGGALLSSLPGALFLASMALVFGTPGLLLVLFRGSVTIDRGAGKVEEVKDFLVRRKVTTTPLDVFAGVRAGWEQTNHHASASDPESEDYTTSLWTVSLTRPEGPSLTVAVVGSADASRQVGRRVSESSLDLPFSDRTGSRRRAAA